MAAQTPATAASALGADGTGSIEKPRFVVVGCGAIGGVYGVSLYTAGFPVKFLVRDSARSMSQRKTLAEKGLELRCVSDPSWGGKIPAEKIPEVFTTDAESCLKEADYVLVATKRTQNDQIHNQLKQYGVVCPVVFLQNGRRVVEMLGQTDYEALECVLNYNTVFDGDEGVVLLTQDWRECSVHLPADKPASTLLAEYMGSCSKLKTMADPDFIGTQCGKFLVNLTNAVNALSGEYVSAMLLQESYRKVLSTSYKEAVAVLTAAGIKPKEVAAFGEMMLASEPVFKAKFGKVLQSRSKGNTSMAQDLMNGQVPTEIDFLNGEVSRLGREVGVPTPVNDKIIELIKKAEVVNKGRPEYTGPELLKLVGLSLEENNQQEQLAPGASAATRGGFGQFGAMASSLATCALVAACAVAAGRATRSKI
mmetsp:Transcript_1955/g.4527  ORF Transcript_1955/g.4527 Transcript_1955/m.4527 type:complete len:422 (+) Transcript_1955:76-1341(+)|eukprot:CAMPEP_0206475840 /NCGR_PEP_ID=MMETSP0324_2-20121206/34338_1 /ASSEMBLY_ACC=CAM_ASM_000836 /TAXON_ID=2866 /ORGANISM="Crypthecodinium cohnii, Strain Seligo" /LENGTH=421 /DNA_ID=CAMNT_0053951313 /DNA_START=67 /DNA_END=1332 /DNA_ORIENTATION=-